MKITSTSLILVVLLLSSCSSFDSEQNYRRFWFNSPWLQPMLST